MPKLHSQPALLSPSARLLGAGNRVQSRPDLDPVPAMPLDLLLDGEVERVEPGRSRRLWRRDVNLVLINGRDDFGNNHADNYAGGLTQRVLWRIVKV